MTVVLLVIVAFACGACAWGSVAALLHRAPELPVEFHDVPALTPLVSWTNEQGPWIVDPAGSLLNARHFRVLTVHGNQVVGEWASAASLDAQSLVAVVSCADAIEAGRALARLAQLLGAERVEVAA